MSAGIHSGRAAAEDSDIVGSSLGPQGGAGSASGRRASSPGDFGTVASDLAGTAAEKSRELLESAKDQAASFADQRKDVAAQSIANIAASLRDTGKGFEEQPNLQSFVSSAADGLDQFATGLRDRSFADLYGDIESYARRQPVAVAALAAAAGFLLARFIKSSAEELSDVNARKTHAGSRGPSARSRA